MEISEDVFSQAKQRMREKREAGHVVAARYDRNSGRIVASLHNGVDVAFLPARSEGLAQAAPDDLAEIEISPSGLALHWPRLDADVYLPAVLQGVFGSKRWMAQQLGAVGGSARSSAKAEAARKNGQLGGRPRHKAA
jgi:hypothetical protein